jgi:hypothetical protein
MEGFVGFAGGGLENLARDWLGEGLNGVREGVGEVEWKF